VAGAIVLLAVAAGAILAGRSGSPGRTVTTSSKLPVFAAGSYRGRRPSSIDFSSGCCSVVKHLTWSSWTDARARATGTFEYDTCVNGCAKGPFDPYRATVELSDPADGQFTVLTRSISTGPTRGLTTWTFPLRWPVGATSSTHPQHG
jgi:hypothetical protein